MFVTETRTLAIGNNKLVKKQHVFLLTQRFEEVYISPGEVHIQWSIPHVLDVCRVHLRSLQHTFVFVSTHKWSMLLGHKQAFLRSSLQLSLIKNTSKLIHKRFSEMHENAEHQSAGQPCERFAISARVGRLRADTQTYLEFIHCKYINSLKHHTIYSTAASAALIVLALLGWMKTRLCAFDRWHFAVPFRTMKFNDFCTWNFTIVCLS